MAKGGKRDIMAGYSKVFAKMFYKDFTSLQMQTQTDADIHKCGVVLGKRNCCTDTYAANAQSLWHNCDK